MRKITIFCAILQIKWAYLKKIANLCINNKKNSLSLPRSVFHHIIYLRLITK